MIPALGVSLLTILVVLQLLESGVGKPSGRLIASAVGVLMLVEGAVVLFASPNLTGDSSITTATHGIAMVVAGAGIWGLAHRALWRRTSAK
jgi:hypothetical protein